jgi:hypothetical protein
VRRTVAASKESASSNILGTAGGGSVREGEVPTSDLDLAPKGKWLVVLKY